MDSFSNFTGIPSGKKKTHRGRRGRGFGAKPAPGTEKPNQQHLHPSAQTHLDKVNAAAEAGDTQGVKSSAFHLVNALHALNRPKAASMSSDAMPGMDAQMTPPSGNMPSGMQAGLQGGSQMPSDSGSY